MMRSYYELAKPRMVYGNLITTIASLLFVSRWHIEPQLLVAVLVGLGLVIASACVCNNILDRDIDARMARTKKRVMVQGSVSRISALLYAIVFGALGFALLYLFVNLVSVVVALVGFVFYVGLYTAIKRYSYLGAAVGAVAGAMPIVLGYTAVTNQFDMIALLLFCTLVFWQMAHFYAISLYRADEYTAAGMPVFAVRHGAQKTRTHVVVYIVATLLSMVALWLYSSLGYAYLLVVLALTFWWLYKAVTYRPVDAVWGRVLFRFSLRVLMGFSLMLALSPFLF